MSNRRVSTSVYSEFGAGSWRRRISRGVEFVRLGEKSREGTARWRVEYRSLGGFHGGDSAERSRESLTRLKQTFPPPSTLFRGRKIRRGLGASSPRAFRWLSENGWVIRGGRKGQLGSWFNPLEKYRGFVKSSFLAILSFVLISFVIKLIRWLV